MSLNSYGHLFRVTTWGESHGPALGATVEGILGLRYHDLPSEHRGTSGLQLWKPGFAPFQANHWE